MGYWAKTTTGIIVKRNAAAYAQLADAYVHINRAWLSRLMQRWYIRTRIDRFGLRVGHG